MHHYTVVLFTFCGLASLYLLWCYTYSIVGRCCLSVFPLPSCRTDGQWTHWDGTEDLIRSRVETCDVDSLFVSLLHPVSCGLDLQCVQPEGWYMTLVKWTPGGRRGRRWKTPLACKQNMQVYSNPLINCQRRFRFVCWCRATLGVVLL